jgi:uncharacterized protein (UPF0276 family)
MTTTIVPSRSWNAGIGFRAPHYDDLIASRPGVGFVEIHAENYMLGGQPWRRLEVLRSLWPVSVHGVGLSLGSADGIDAGHLERLARLVERIEPGLVSEHLSFSVVDGVYLNDLLPIPYTEEALAVVADNVARVQDRLRRRILIENPSAYVRFVASALSEAEFLGALSERTGCGVLLDVNNVFVSCANLGGEPMATINAVPAHAVVELHLAGHAVNDAGGTPVCIDDHGSAVAPPVWRLYEAAVRRFPTAVTLIEWDCNLPPLPLLVDEAGKADARRQSALSEVDHAAAA